MWIFLTKYCIESIITIIYVLLRKFAEKMMPSVGVIFNRKGLHIVAMFNYIAVIFLIIFSSHIALEKTYMCNRVIFNCALRVYCLVSLMGVSSFVVSCPMIVMRGNVWVLSFVLLIVFVSVHRLLGQLWGCPLTEMYATQHASVAG